MSLEVLLRFPQGDRVIGYAYGCEVFCGNCWGRGVQIDLTEGADKNAPCSACGGLDLREKLNDRDRDVIAEWADVRAPWPEDADE